MGKLVYNSVVVDFDDRALVHLQIVIGSKLRRGESFFLSWHEPPTGGSGRASLWLHPSIPLHFKYVEGEAPSINRAWIDALTASANSGQGLVLSTEPRTQASRQHLRVG
ncbi:ATP-dependent DNA ligase [Cryobacterium sp. SO1]|uniref:DUF7882 family protein n=1 Tax=Cryobacterium sp. SO1 TaxID=1897061 RepID=UPI0010238DDC|nr:ATP-dependent DNA ligase [Cryobacterium sp. SO1]RZI36535.1 hypothetical protein BJQ95_01063 [Cryobacterium sp. SO1]